MGRPYAAELLELDATYEWAIRAAVSELARSVAQSAHHPLITVGSGGSLTSAHFAGLLHTRLTGQAAQTLTPYELVTTPQQLAGSSILICSAGGSNPDVITAAELVIKRSPRQLFAVTTRIGSLLQEQLEAAAWPRCHAFDTPIRKDGFLATNSLLATIVLLTRAYETWIGAVTCLPPTLEALLHPNANRRDFLDECRDHLASVMQRATLIVLHGAATKPAAMDVESRFTEAALANVQPADFRNFAHGRHHWLARHPESSAVLAFSESGDQIARRTLSLLPASIPRWQVSVEPGLRGALAAICQSLLLAEIAGTAKGIDPGRPHVPAFGRKLYHLRAMPRLYPRADGARERMNLAIERKSGLPLFGLAIRGELDDWYKHYSTFIERLSKARIRAIVVDYDGTLCAPERRLDGLSSPIAKRLNALLAAGATVAVATGRGKSVREALCRHVTDPQHRARLIVGYHNGAEIAPLSDATCPEPKRPLAPELATIAKALQGSATIVRHATVEAKGKQIALELLPAGDRTALWDEAVRVVDRHYICGISLVTSSHSVDVIAPGVNKANVVDDVVKRLRLSNGGATCVLCIGDRGRTPGNDADLLRHPLSLSVDEISADPTTCWAIAEPGLRFDLACLEYFTRLRPGKTGMRFDVKGVRP
jgi:fructoselysine-6-P-deglycase FrlB-like protein/hydroxymethylpyrimidine pyrophosphatase-like HAD family hydrolase